MLLQRRDHAQDFLIPYLQETERLFAIALRQIDSKAECTIRPAADLGIPHDVIRLVGGFATGCLVNWKCDTPVIPVDTTVNIDTSSIFYLSADISNLFHAQLFNHLRQTIESNSSYEWNFHKGNHFISHAIDDTGRHALIVHSNEKEFKYQYNGLMPVPGNWFMNDVRNFGTAERPMNLLIGEKAKQFVKMAKMLEEYNITRHRFIATIILESTTSITDEYHKHHYFMPTASSVALGCYLCKDTESVPIFSKPGRPITMFQPKGGKSNMVFLDSMDPVCIVPHGWGKTAIEPICASINKELILNDMEFQIRPISSLGTHPKLHLREFSDDFDSPESFFSQISDHCPGRVTGILHQIQWHNKDGTISSNTVCG